MMPGAGPLGTELEVVQHFPVPEIRHEDRMLLVQFCHVRKVINLLGLPGAEALSEETIASLYGLTTHELASARKGLLEAARSTAELMLERNDLRDAVRMLPFRSGDRVLVVGDSITEDSSSWAQILQFLLDATRCEDRIRVFNGGVSGDTSTDLVTRLRVVTRARPEWVIIMIGTNDARRHGRELAPPLVSNGETARNLALIRVLVESRGPIGLIWITPPPVVEERILACGSIADADLMWRNQDLAAKAEIVRALPDCVVDLWPAFGCPALPDLLLDDGLHPSRAGQARIAESLIAAMVGM